MYIPRNELFAYSIDWSIVERFDIAESTLRPWIVRKIAEYLGEEEATLVQFIVTKIATNCNPQELLGETRVCVCVCMYVCMYWCMYLRVCKNTYANIVYIHIYVIYNIIYIHMYGVQRSWLRCWTRMQSPLWSNYGECSYSHLLRPDWKPKERAHTSMYIDAIYMLVVCYIVVVYLVCY
jgi:hypothetical protein